MKTFNIFTNQTDSLPDGKADFLLGASVTKTCEIQGITQAGIPTMIPLTPTLDAEFITNQEIYSLDNLAETPSGIPTPALITRAVHNLSPFSNIEVLNLGLITPPEFTNLRDFQISPSDSIATGANINAKEVFAKGMKYGLEYELKGSYLILGESTPSGTTTAAASCLALGFACKNDFSSSFLNSPDSIKSETIRQAIRLTTQKMTNFEKLNIVSDNMLLFCAGFLLEASRRFHVVLAGGTQMAAVLLIADTLKADVLMRLKSDNISLATTGWVVHDPHSDIQHLLSLLSYTPHAIYTEVSFANADIPVLKKYDEGEAKEGVGAGASLAYANKNGHTNQEILDSIELIMYAM